MEDTAKGFYITLTTIFIFILCITQFILVFPQDQGVDMSNTGGASGSAYLTISQMDTDPSVLLSNMNNQSQEGFDQWDVTQGFMGSNSIKQSSQGGFRSQVRQMYTSIVTMATIVFGANSPVLTVLAILFTAVLGYIIYVVVQFVRTGR